MRMGQGPVRVAGGGARAPGVADGYKTGELGPLAQQAGTCTACVRMQEQHGRRGRTCVLCACQRAMTLCMCRLRDGRTDVGDRDRCQGESGTGGRPGDAGVWAGRVRRQSWPVRGARRAAAGKGGRNVAYWRRRRRRRARGGCAAGARREGAACSSVRARRRCRRGGRRWSALRWFCPALATRTRSPARQRGSREQKEKASSPRPGRPMRSRWERLGDERGLG